MTTCWAAPTTTRPAAGPPRPWRTCSPARGPAPATTAGTWNGRSATWPGSAASGNSSTTAPGCLAHGRVRALVAADHSTAYIQEDARNTGAVLAHPGTRRIIDFSQPVAVMYISFLHCIPDADDPWGLVRRMMDRTAPGSYLVISHGVSDDPEVRRTVTETLVAATGGNWGRLRERDEVRTFFDGLDPVDPGLVDVTAWRPDGGEEEQTEAGTEFGGVARKP